MRGTTINDPLTIHITGSISLATLSAGELGELLKNLADAVLSVAGRQSDASLPVFPLTGIADGSLVLTFGADSRVHEAAGVVCRAFAKGDVTSLPDPSRRAVLALSRWSRKFSYSLEWWQGGRSLGIITPQLELTFQTAPMIRGTTTLAGMVRSVGGERPSFKLRLPTGELIICQCSEDLAQTAGKYLYRTVSVAGTARHNVRTGELGAFEVSSVTLSERRIQDAFRKIRDEFGSSFDAVDTDIFMDQVRG